ncbi:MAG: 50S ribosomal protein L6 [bacterium]|nr:50S ribosomal protein L6 [bacterium]
MSRIGKQIISIPSGVQITHDGFVITVKGPKGQLTQKLHPHVSVSIDESTVQVNVADTENKLDRSLWGLSQRLISNMVQGVTAGYEKKLEINGVGFKVALGGSGLNLSLGFSHPTTFVIPQGVTATVEKNVVTFSSIDKQLLGETAAQLRRLKPPEVYKGKGIKYSEEVIRRKAGKTAKA